MDVGVRTRRHVATDTVGPSDTSEVAVPRLGIEFFRGDVIGDYVIDGELGRGGMGAVYAAVHAVIEKRVAIKILRRELSNDDEAVNRFVQEARAVNRIRHEGIVDVFGYGTTDDGCCFLVMELLEGESLGRMISHATMSVPQVCDVLVQVTHALEAAHAAGVVHRDLKPDNVFLVGSRVKLLDFGIAKLTAPTEHASVDYTQLGQVIGTPSYIAPEQARGAAVDGRTDIYSLGVMAFELLVGRRPFESDNAMEMIAHHITMPPPRPTQIAPALPPVADTLLLSMLEKDPARRPSLARVREVLGELRVASPATKPLARSRRMRWWIPAGAGIALGAAGIAGWMLVADRDEPPAPVAPVATPAIAPAVAPAPSIAPAKKAPAAEPAPTPDRAPIVDEGAKLAMKPAPAKQPPPHRKVRKPQATAPGTEKPSEIPVERKEPSPPPTPPTTPPPVQTAPKPSPANDRDNLKGLHLPSSSP